MNDLRCKAAPVALAWAVVAASGGVSHAGLSDGLLVHWKFDDGAGATTAADSSGNNRNGTITDATWTDQGRSGGALSFDGTATCQVEDTGGPTYINGLSAITCAVWVKSNAIGTNSGFVIGEVPAGSDDTLAIRYDEAGASADPDGTNVIKVGLTTSGGLMQMESAENVQTTDWQHLALVWSDGNALTLYIDGVATTPTYIDAATTGTVSGITTLIVGKGCKDIAADATSWNGLVDDFRIYNRDLSETEINDLMKQFPDANIEPVDSDAAETTAGPDAATFNVTLTQAAPADVTVNLLVTESEPTGGCDFTISPDISAGLLVTTGETSLPVTLTPTEDSNPELPQTVTIDLQAGDGYDLGGTTQVVISLTDDDVPGDFTLDSPPDGQEVSGFSPTLTITWTAPTAPPADGGYTVHVARDQSFTDLVVDGAAVAAGTTQYDIPEAQLSEDMQYWWKVTAHNAAGSTEASNAPFSFLTPDTTAPWVRSAEPSPGDDRVDIGTDIRLTFNEEIQVTGDLQAAVTVSGGVTGQVEWANPDRTLTLVFTPDSDLKYATKYTVTVTSGITDKSNNLNSLDGNKGELVDYKFSFTTFERLTGLAVGEGCLPVARTAGVASGAALVVLVLAVALLKTLRRHPGTGG